VKRELQARILQFQIRKSDFHACDQVQPWVHRSTLEHIWKRRFGASKQQGTDGKNRDARRKH